MKEVWKPIVGWRGFYQCDHSRGNMGMAMKRERPPMPPLAVRVEVAKRQLREVNKEHAERVIYGGVGSPLGVQLRRLLEAFRWASGLDQESPLALDHDPALILRQYNPRIKDVAARYTPHAHSADDLLYRRKGNHDQKTFGRKEGAAKTVTTKGSDIGLKAKFNRLEGRTKPKKKTNWPKGRKLQSRKFQPRSKP